jgi:glycosyltransferase involved in cell wall biosynthesis
VRRSMGTVCWRLSARDPDLASVRYRAAIPARGLAGHGVSSQLSWGHYGVLGRERPDAVVFVKTFAARDLELAREAAGTRVPVLLDVCDNVFAEGYTAHSAENLERMAELASAITTTGPALADVLRSRLEPPVHVVPDPVETPGDVRYAERLLRRERLALALRERQQDLPLAAAGVIRQGLRVRRPSARRDELPQVLWFGNAGSRQPRFGIANLADIGPELEQAAAETPFGLVVVTSDEDAYRFEVEPLGLPTRFARWDRRSIFDHMAESAVVVVPNSRDEFSVCKSANRVTLALSQGVPVVATRIPSLEPLAECVLFDDFRAGVSAYLRDRKLAAEHLARAEPVLEREFSAEAVAERWLSVLSA